MTADLLTHALLGLLPVCCFLAALVYLDSYKLVKISLVLLTILAGILSCVAAWFVNSWLLEILSIEFTAFTRYVAPLSEEALKALVIVGLLFRNRVGFLVDAAILGFATGAGFAILENLLYLNGSPGMPLGTWIVRGFGTAIMHGGATALFALIAHRVLGQRRTLGPVAIVPAFLAASAVHSLFNHFFFSPLVNTLIYLTVLPLILTVVFERSERAVSHWLGMGFDADAELLELINSGGLSDSRVGRYLHSLKERFEGPVVADLLCYLRLHTELSLRAKGLLMMRESGFANKVGSETRAKLEELKYLESSIGRTGLLALKPFLQFSREDLWQIYMLRKA